MIWSHVAHHYMDSFQKARRSKLDVPIKLQAVRTLAEEPMDLPGWRLDHLIRMTDSAGILQHASYTIPNLGEGYCTDDNARALLLTLLLEQLGVSSVQIQRLTASYSAFLNYAFDRNLCRFRNFMSYNRSWLEPAGSEDCQGRALWALGACVHRSRRRDLQFWSSELFDLGLPALLETTSPRTWSFGLLGVCHYLERLSGAPGESDPRHADRSADRVVRGIRDRGVVLVRTVSYLRQCQALPGADRQRTVWRACPGAGYRAQDSDLAGQSAKGTRRSLPSHRFRRILQAKW